MPGSNTYTRYPNRQKYLLDMSIRVEENICRGNLCCRSCSNDVTLIEYKAVITIYGYNLVDIYSGQQDIAKMIIALA